MVPRMMKICYVFELPDPVTQKRSRDKLPIYIYFFFKCSPNKTFEILYFLMQFVMKLFFLLIRKLKPIQIVATKFQLNGGNHSRTDFI